MIRIRMIGLSLVAMFAMSAVVTSAASAVPAKPYFKECAPVAAGTGTFEKSTCTGAAGTKEFIWVAGGNTECREVTTAGTGTFEKSTCAGAAGTKEFIKVKTPLKNKFTSKSGAGKLVTAGGEEVKCTGDTDTGETTGPKTVGNVVVKFTGCEAF